MQHAEDTNGLALDFVDHDVRGARDNQFACSAQTANAADLWMVEKLVCRIDHTLFQPRSGAGVMLRDIIDLSLLRTAERVHASFMACA